MKEVNVNCRWTVSENVLHVQLIGHKGNRDYGLAINRTFPAGDTRLERFSKNATDTLSLAGTGKPYRTGTATFNYSLILNINGKSVDNGTEVLLLNRDSFLWFLQEVKAMEDSGEVK